VHALAPVAGLPGGIEPIVVRGRPPSSSDEVALGAKSLAATHAALGDSVELTSVSAPAAFPGWSPSRPCPCRTQPATSSFWPALLTLVVGVFALSAFLHAPAVMVRRQRRQRAVLRALGFRRGQLSATVSWYVAALLVPALVVGVPLGVVAGRWG
jgi:hypothetical protein